MNRKPTHKLSTIDHIISTNPVKLTNTQTLNTHLSDHLLVRAVRATKKVLRQPRFTTSRKYAEINFDEMKSDLNTDQRLYWAMGQNDPDIIADTIIKVVREQLDARAPQRRMQVRRVKTTNSERTTTLIKQRNDAWNRYKDDDILDNLREYNSLKRQVKKSLTIDKIDKDKRDVQQAANSRDQWKESKRIMGWTQYAGPRLLIKNGVPITSPKEMATTINMDQIIRTAKAARAIPAPTIDPMISYQKMLAGKKTKYGVPANWKRRTIHHHKVHQPLKVCIYRPDLHEATDNHQGPTDANSTTPSKHNHNDLKVSSPTEAHQGDPPPQEGQGGD